jgi:hypothetical protein
MYILQNTTWIPHTVVQIAGESKGGIISSNVGGLIEGSNKKGMFLDVDYPKGTIPASTGLKKSLISLFRENARSVRH